MFTPSFRSPLPLGPKVDNSLPRTGSRNFRFDSGGGFGTAAGSLRGFEAIFRSAGFAGGATFGRFFGGAQQAAIRKAGDMRAAGTPISYIRTTFAPEDGRCMCLFEADSDDAVKRLNDEAGLPYERVVAALDLTPQG